jgi:predicted murein hydrolase (TIGR00659 family)
MRAFWALWPSLELSPLTWLAITLGAYVAGQQIQRACGGSVLANPVLIAIMLVGGILLGTGTSYDTYFAGAQFINALLGPATVALAIPLARNMHHVRRSLHGLGLALLAGSVTSIVSAMALVWLLGGSREVALSMAPKAATTPIAVTVSQTIGGLPALTAALAIIAGITVAVIGRPILRTLRVEDWRARGLAAGTAGSGIGAAQIAPLDETAAAFAAIGIGLNGLITALLAPLLAPLLLLLWR